MDAEATTSIARPCPSCLGKKTLYDGKLDQWNDCHHCEGKGHTTQKLSDLSPFHLLQLAIQLKSCAIKTLRQPDPCAICKLADPQEQNLQCQGAAGCPHQDRATALRLLDTLRAPAKF